MPVTFSKLAYHSNWPGVCAPISTKKSELQPINTSVPVPFEAMPASNSVIRSQALRPMEQTALWTFGSALTLIKEEPLLHILDALDEFLLHLREEILLADPFAGEKKLLEKVNDITLRGVLFANVLQNIEVSNKLAKLLKVDPKEALRVVVQTQLRIPELEDVKGSLSLLSSRIRDDRDKARENDRITVYASMLLREKRTVLRIARECLNRRFNESATSTIRNLGRSLVLDSKYAALTIDTLSRAASAIVLGSYKTGIDALDDVIYTETLLFMLELLSLLCEIFVSHVGAGCVTKWFEFMDETNFMVSLGSFVSNRECFVLLQSLATIVSLQVLNVESPMEINDQSYINDGKAFKLINDIISTRNINSIVNYAWLIILYKKAIVVEELLDALAPFTKEISLAEINTSIAFFTETLELSNVFQDIIKINSFLHFDEIFSVVLASLLMVALPLMPMNVETATCVQQVLSQAPPPVVERFYENSEVAKAIVLARAKFPVSISPYLKLASINGSFAFSEFRELKSYMSVFDKEAFGRVCDIDSENTDLMKLSEMVDLYPPYEVNNKLSLLLGLNTKAKVIPSSEDGKVLVTFLYKFSGWAFLGRVVQNISKTFDIYDEQKMLVLNDMLHLLVQTSTQVSPDDLPLALEAMSAYTDDSDILEILFRLLEQGLHNRDTEILTKVMKVLTNLLPLHAGRIWPHLSKSSLLPNGGKEPFMSIMFGSIETVRGNYEFTVALTKFIGALAHNCLANKHDYSDVLKGEVLSVMVEHAIVLFESFINCNFNDGLQKLELGILLLDVFTKIITTVFDTNWGNSRDNEPAKEFVVSAKKILDAFLSPADESARAPIPIYKMVSSVASSLNYYDFRDVTGFYSKHWVKSALIFSKELIRRRSLITSKPSQFEKQMFAQLQNLVKIYSRGSFRKPVLDLITALTSGVWEGEQMPSMLSHLGREYSRIFLHSLASDLKNSFDDYGIRISVYDLLCSILEASQEGLSVLFISGRDVFRGSKSDQPLTISLLTVLKKNVNEIKYYPPSVTVHLLDAISLAFNSWTITNEDNSDEHFVKEMLKLLDDGVDGSLKTSQELIAASYRNKVLSKSAEILSLVLFTTKNEKIKSLIVDFLYTDTFVEKVPRYLSPVLSKGPTILSISQSFEEQFPKNKLSQFATSVRTRNRFNANAMYEMDMMETLFQSNPEWASIRGQIEDWSARVQNYYSQVAIAKSLGALITALCRRLPSKELTSYVRLVPEILTINIVEEPYILATALQLRLERVELSFLLSQTNGSVDKTEKDTKVALSIIEKASTMLNAASDLDSSTLLTHRALLRLAHIALSTLKDDHELIISKFSVLLDFFNRVVSQGSRLIITQLQNDVYLSRTDKNHKSQDLGELLNDLRLVISIFKCYVSFNIPDSLQCELANSLTNSKTVDNFLSLYSFSHLITVNEEPIFSHLTLMFMQLLLSVEVFAEKFINRNLFMVIRESVISQPLREGGITVENSPQLHRNWTTGILPIISATLLGPGKKSEVFNTIRSFGRQILFCVESWAKDSLSLRVSSAATWETTQILYLYLILSEIAKAENIASENLTSVDMAILPGLETPQKREDLMDYISNLLKHPKFLSSIIVPSTPEEAKILSSHGQAHDEFVKGIILEIFELKDYFN